MCDCESDNVVNMKTNWKNRKIGPLNDYCSSLFEIGVLYKMVLEIFPVMM